VQMYGQMAAATGAHLGIIIFSGRQHSIRIARYILSSVRPSVCPSVCLSHGWIIQKRLKIGFQNYHHTVAHSSICCMVSFIRKF